MNKITIKSIFFIGLLVILLFFVKILQDIKPSNKAIEILFIGDSLTHGRYAPVLHYNRDKITDLNAQLPSSNPRYERKKSEPGPWGGIPGIFKQFTLEKGLNYNVSIEAISSRSLAFHAKQANTEQANQSNPPPIFQAKWNVVVMQDFSTEPLPNEREGNKQKFLEGIHALSKGFRQLNPKVMLYLYQTWPTAVEVYSSDGRYANIQDPMTALKTMKDDLYYGYSEAAKSCCKLIPVGNAWFDAINTQVALSNPSSPIANQINLWAKDQLHPSVYGSYLSALVIFSTVTGLDPRTLCYEEAAKTLGIPCEIAYKLEEIAYRATRI